MTHAGATKCSAGIVSTELFGQIAAGDPVDRRVEVRAGVLAAREVVPVPARPARVVVRHLLDPERPALAHLGRQRDLRKLGRERLREVDDADAPARERRRQLGEQRRPRRRASLELRRRGRGGGGCHGPNGRMTPALRATCPSGPARNRGGRRRSPTGSARRSLRRSRRPRWWRRPASRRRAAPD